MPFLDQDIICDWLVIGSGFAGISAAKRLTELRSGDKIILIDAIGIGEGGADIDKHCSKHKDKDHCSRDGHCKWHPDKGVCRKK